MSGYRPIEDYGVIGDLNTVALVGLDGSIDYMCFPNLDSPSMFAALLDRERGGSFQIHPVIDPERHRQFYLPDTNVLMTRFLSRDGVAELSDFMPVEETGYEHNLVRRVKTVRGEIPYRMVCDPRFDYGRATHVAELQGDSIIFTSRGADGTVVRLRSSHPMRIVDGKAVAEFTLGAREHAWFVLEEAQGASPSEAPHYVADAFKATVNYWRRWIGRCTYTGRWREAVHRSALVLKLLTSRRHGSIAAAATFGLPEEIGGVRNWDYRFAWIRDASFTIYAFMRLGFHEEAKAFFRWIERLCEAGDSASGPLQIMYGLDGRKELLETHLDHFVGYRGSSPVRIGNAAYDQLQLDIYGELMDSIYIFDKYEEPIHYDLWVRLTQIVEWVRENWRRPDEGIWEVRGGRREFLCSRVMCWVAIDRAVRLARKRSLPAPLVEWSRTRDEIYRDIFETFWSEERRAFIQHKGGSALDASALLMPLVKIVSPSDPRWLSTLAIIEEELVEDSFVFRYKNHDGLSGEEGTFTICGFWFAECVSRAGDLQKARFYFEKLLGHANHVGLFAEELGPCGEHLGNYPQAFTHLALISAAYDIDRRLSAPR